MQPLHPFLRYLLRLTLLWVSVFATCALAYLCWSPGDRVRDGRHDRRTNGIWIQHGWLGADEWFTRYHKDPTRFRSDEKIRELAALLAGHGVRYVYPHLCPCSPDGRIAPADAAQAERFLDHCGGLQVLPWIGGILNTQCFPESAAWRSNFVASTSELLQAHPRLAGVHLNIEPLPDGNPDFLLLLDELHRALPPGKILSLAAYPPPTRWHSSLQVHWQEAYFREVSRRVDQVCPMLYDTAARVPKLYQQVVAGWVPKLLAWSGDRQVLLGVPAGAGRHAPFVENLPKSITAVHAGLNRLPALPANYAGVAVYCEWEMTPQKWLVYRREFEKPAKDSP
jgi:hypothetical protein